MLRMIGIFEVASLLVWVEMGKTLLWCIKQYVAHAYVYDL